MQVNNGASITTESTGRGYAFGLRSRLLMLVLLIVVLASGAMVVFLQALRTVEDALNTIVGADVPRLNLAVQLSTQAQTVVGLVPALSRSGSDAAREGTRHRIDQELNDIDVTLKALATHGGDADRLTELGRYLADIRSNVRQLDSIVARRFTLEASLVAAMERLHQARVNLRALPTTQTATLPWQLASYDVLGAAAEAVQLANPNELQKLIEEVEKQVRQIQPTSADRASSPPASTKVRQEVVRVASGPASPARLRLDLLRLNYWQDTRLSVNTSLSDRFLRTASQFGSETQAGVSATALQLREQLKRHQAVSATAFAAILGGMLVMVAYVSHFVVRRLLLIRDNIRSYLNHDKPPPIPSFGRDEVGDIARALNFYVQLIAEREAALGAAKNDAESALHDLRQTQAGLVQAEKLASLGSLVAGVAHELNTPIGNALVTASTLEDAAHQFEAAVDRGEVRRSAAKDFAQKSTQMAELIARSCHRAASLITSFKQVAVDQTSEKRRRFDLRGLTEDIVTSLRPTFKNAPWVIDIQIPEHIACDSYPGPLGQVMSNLIQNAVNHAFDGRDNGNLCISATVSPNGVNMRFEDNGKGMDEPTLIRIFEPFFTTRLGKGGSGLGLSVSLNIATGMLGGSLKVNSQPGQGTTFTLDFPLVAPHGDQAIQVTT